MSYLVVITFDDAEEAGQVRDTLSKVQGEGYVSLDDSAVVVKDKEGKIHIKNEMDRGVKVGAVGGGALGLLIASFIFPFAGLIIGALGGALLGSLLDKGIDKNFVKQVADELQPGNSAIFFILREQDPGIAIAALRSYKGRIYQTSLPSEAEEALRQAIKDRQ